VAPIKTFSYLSFYLN